MKKYTAKDIGCWADGAGGWRYVRKILAGLVEPWSYGLACELRAESSDDASEEDDALDLLNENTEDGLLWTFHDGDLVLMQEDENVAS